MPRAFPTRCISLLAQTGIARRCLDDGEINEKDGALFCVINKEGRQFIVVRGIPREQNEPLLRLADGVCGLVRDAHAGKVEHKALMFQSAVEFAREGKD